MPLNIKKYFPRATYPALEYVSRTLGSFKYRGTGRFCGICGTPASVFKPSGNPLRSDALCWRCRSLERHRLLWHYLSCNAKQLQLGGKQVLHVAPEACLEKKFRKFIGNHYTTADLFSPNVDIKVDITDIQFPDDHFDAIICNHVLEHVVDDRKAMRELLRVLKPGGMAIMMVPLTESPTYEDHSITTPEGRLEAFGQTDHVRICGPDYVDRLGEAGFLVEQISPSDLADEGTILKLGLGGKLGRIFVGRKDSPVPE